MLKFSPANRKLRKLERIPFTRKWLGDNKRIYSFDLPAGHTCPAAETCLAKIYLNTAENKWRIKDGPKQTVRCYAASEEVIFANVRNLRWNNLNTLKDTRLFSMYEMISAALPFNAGIVRLHSSGDFFNYAYWLTWKKIAIKHPDILFYTYTKNAIQWLNKPLPSNFVVTASYGGKWDSLISEWNLKSATIVFSESEAEDLGLKIDVNDSLAANPNYKKSFALLVHGNGPIGSTQAKLHNNIARGVTNG